MIKKTKRVSLKNPVFIACWPGMGEVSLRTGLFLKDALEFEPFAEVKDSGFFMPQGIVSDQGIIAFPEIDEGTFYVYKDPKKQRDVVLFLSEAQPSMDRAYAFAQMIMDFVASLKIKLVFTFASLPQPIDYAKDSNIWCVCTDDELRTEIREYAVELLPEGQISGLNGLLAGVAGELGLRAVCYLAEIPFYTVQIENPKATKALLKILARYLDLDFDLSSFDAKSKNLEVEIERLINYIRGETDEEEEEELPLSEEDIQKIRNELARFPQLPKSVVKKIEDLFEKARAEISYAQELKKLLDHWGVYKDHEDRFLDLFREQGLDH